MHFDRSCILYNTLSMLFVQELSGTDKTSLKFCNHGLAWIFILRSLFKMVLHECLVANCILINKSFPNFYFTISICYFKYKRVLIDLLFLRNCRFFS